MWLLPSRHTIRGVAALAPRAPFVCSFSDRSCDRVFCPILPPCRVLSIAQANYFVNAVNGAGGLNSNTMQLVLDLEDDDGVGPDATWAFVQVCV